MSQPTFNRAVAPDVAGVIEGWRGWRFAPGVGLQSMYQEDYWLPGEEMRAKCAIHSWPPERLPSWQDCVEHLTHLEQRTGIPSKDCHCGIYAVEEGGYYGQIQYGIVIGKVAMWGKVIRGTDATRAEYAYPIVLYAPTWLLHDQTLLSYGVPVLRISELPSHIRQERRRRGLPLRALAMGAVGIALNAVFGARQIMAGSAFGWFNIGVSVLIFSMFFLAPACRALNCFLRLARARLVLRKLNK